MTRTIATDARNPAFSRPRLPARLAGDLDPQARPVLLDIRMRVAGEPPYPTILKNARWPARALLGAASVDELLQDSALIVECEAERVIVAGLAFSVPGQISFRFRLANGSADYTVETLDLARQTFTLALVTCERDLE